MEDNKTTKKCLKCRNEKSISEFYKHKGRKDGLSDYCKICTSIKTKAYYKNNKEKCAIYNKQYRKDHQEDLSKKKKQYYKNNRNEFINKSREYSQNHKEEIAERRKQYRVKHKDEIAKYKKQHYNSNKAEITEKNKKYRQNHKKEIALNKRQYERNKRISDPLFMLIHRLRSRLRAALKGNSKSSKTKELIGCSLEFLQRWLKSTIEESADENMFHIDHIVPYNSFELSYPQQQFEVNNWMNLRLISKEENLLKSDKRDSILEAQYIIKSKMFEDLYNQPLY